MVIDCKVITVAYIASQCSKKFYTPSNPIYKKKKLFFLDSL
jgi:hypothetical protein